MKNHFSTIADLQSQLLSFNIRAVDVVNTYLQRIKDNQNLNIFIETFDTDALSQAQKIDEKLNNKQSLGPLFGVVISIKDVFCYQGHSVSAASKMLQNYVASYSATVIEKLLEHDAIIIGRVNCDEFAMGGSNENSVYGAAKNPHDTTRITGGSSGGSAASLAANLCMISIGSDTGGSVRQPADFCGVYGFKPSYGKISRYGLIAYASSLDTVGILGHSIQDIQIVLNCVAGVDKFDNTAIQYTPPPQKQKEEKLTIGYFKEILSYKMEKEISQTFDSAIKRFAKRDNIEAIDFPFLDYLVPTYYIIACAEASSNLGRYDGIRYGWADTSSIKDLKDFYKKNRSQGFGVEVKRRIMMGNFVLSSGYYDAYYNKAQQIRTIINHELNSLFEKYDAIIMPNTPCLPWKIGSQNNVPIEQIYLADIFSVLANLISCPAISIPFSKHSNGLPLGIQLLAKKGNDENLLDLAQKFSLNTLE